MTSAPPMVGTPNDLISYEDAQDIADLITDIAHNAAAKAVNELQGAHREYAWGIYDPLGTPLYIHTFNVTLACKPIDFTITTDRNFPATAGSFQVLAYLPIGYEGGGAWQALSGILAVNGIFAGNTTFGLKQLPVGTLLTMQMHAGGGGKGITGQLRVQRIHEHEGGRRG